MLERIGGVIVLVGIWVTIVLGISSTPEPEPQLVLPVEVTEVYDGDTVTCRLTLDLRVRLLDCWAPELRDREGSESRDNLASLAEGKSGRLVVPLEGADRLDDVLTFGRVLGYVWVDGKNLSVEQVESGYATKTRRR